MEKKFNQGDVVCLNSGGENMTVAGYKERNTGSVLNAIGKRFGGKANFPEVDTQTVICTWFEGKKMQTAEFEENLLKLVTPAQ